MRADNKKMIKIKICYNFQLNLHNIINDLHLKPKIKS